MITVHETRIHYLAMDILSAMTHDGYELARRARGWVLTPPQELNTPQPYGTDIAEEVVDYMALHQGITIEGDTVRVQL